MNEYIFYTCVGYTEPPLKSKEVENCQVLGRAKGNTPKEAKELLIKNNPWIEECGFDIESIISKQLLSDENKKDISLVLDYLIEEEFRHYQELEEPEDHIYKILLRLKDMIK